MARELTEEEIAFIEESILSRDSATDRREEAREKRIKRVRTSPIFNLRVWAALVMALPILGTILLYVFIFQATSAVGGADNLNWLASQKMDTPTKNMLKQYNLEWLPQILGVYNQRYIIIGVMFTIGIVIAVALLMLDAWRRQRHHEEIN